MMINETFLNLFDPKDKAPYADEVFTKLQAAYAKVDGIHGSGFRSAQDMVNNIPFWKLVKRNGSIVAGAMYKDKQGRKKVAIFSDGTETGKDEVKDICVKDLERAWSEVSDRSLSVILKVMGSDIKRYLLTPEKVAKLTGDEISVPDKNDPELTRHPQFAKYFYQREIGGKLHTKLAMGNPHIRIESNKRFIAPVAKKLSTDKDIDPGDALDESSKRISAMRAANHQRRMGCYEHDPIFDVTSNDVNRFVLKTIVSDPTWKRAQKFSRLIQRAIRMLPGHMNSKLVNTRRINKELTRMKGESTDAPTTARTMYLIDKDTDIGLLSLDYDVYVAVLTVVEYGLVVGIEGAVDDVEAAASFCGAEEWFAETGTANEYGLNNTPVVMDEAYVLADMSDKIYKTIKQKLNGRSLDKKNIEQMVQMFAHQFDHDGDTSKIVDKLVNEKMIVLGKIAYPKFGQVVILAGGIASGKSFVLNNMLGIEGRIFDVDKLKVLALKSPLINAKVKELLHINLSEFNLGNPDHATKLHEILGEILGIDKKSSAAVLSSVLVASPDRKPNLIFDSSLKSATKLKDTVESVVKFGYDRKNIHLVWVLNDVTVSIAQNKARERVAPEDVLQMTHIGASNSMRQLFDANYKIQNILNGDIVVAFNNKEVDSNITKSQFGGRVVDKYNYIKLKQQGKPMMKTNELAQEILDKIIQYTPKDGTWAPNDFTK